jgi:hypothetical protein
VTDPFFITGPAIISFSGGRTSGYMLWRILQAHGGKLPDDVIVTFANTGKEHWKTLDFVMNCGVYWDVPIVWLEWRDGKPGFAEVTYEQCSKEGEPFAALIAKKKYLPNAVTRYCTIELKIRVIKHYAMSLGWKHWDSVVGLRYDEGHRVMKALERNETASERWKTRMPLSTAKITKRDVMEFWRAQPFDLNLMPYQGNCDMCFLKRKTNRKQMIRDDRDVADWWIEQEEKVGASRPSGNRFDLTTTYADLKREAVDQLHLFDFLDDEHDAECGLVCAGDEASAIRAAAGGGG